jgi:hypothetical protein
VRSPQQIKVGHVTLPNSTLSTVPERELPGSESLYRRYRSLLGTNIGKRLVGKGQALLVMEWQEQLNEIHHLLLKRANPWTLTCLSVSPPARCFTRTRSFGLSELIRARLSELGSGLEREPGGLDWIVRDRREERVDMKWVPPTRCRELDTIIELFQIEL